MKAIAAMALNRVIGRANALPWDLPEDLRWFKQCTRGHVLVMGRKTYESIGRPLPGRDTVVLSRTLRDLPGVTVVADFDDWKAPADGREVWVCGGEAVYRQLLPRCSDLFLTLVRAEVEGDALFPPFEDGFKLAGVVREGEGFEVRHYVRRASPPAQRASQS